MSSLNKVGHNIVKMKTRSLFFAIIIVLFVGVSSQTLTNAWHELFNKLMDPLQRTKRQTTNKTTKPLCDENKLMFRIAKLQIISPDSLITMLSAPNIFDFCRQYENLESVNGKEALKCTPLPKDNLYVKLLQGCKELCSPFLHHVELKKEYSKYESCFQELAEEYVDCQGPDDWYETTNLTIACRTSKDILNCMFVKTVRLCGREAAHMMYSMSQKPFEAVLQHNCQIPEPNGGARITDGQTSKYILSIVVGFMVIRYI